MSRATSPSEHHEARLALEARIASGTHAPQPPRSLPWETIEQLPEVFQHRRSDTHRSEEHVQTLARSIKRGPRGAKQAALAPVTVYWVGDAWACVDGHHRLQAYRLVQHPSPVPVKVLQGMTLAEATHAALGANSKDQLRLSPRCRTEAAWRFTFESPALSKAQIAALSGVDDSTVATMRREKVAFLAAHPEADPAGFSWGQMRCWRNNSGDASLEDQEHAKAEQLLRRIGRHIEGTSPEVLLRALSLHSPRLVPALVELHAQHSRHAAYAADPFPFVDSPLEDAEF